MVPPTLLEGETAGEEIKRMGISKMEMRTMTRGIVMTLCQMIFMTKISLFKKWTL